MLKPINHRHWMDSVPGTAITNFDSCELLAYQKAIERYGKPFLVISDQPIHAPGRYHNHGEGKYSLHDLRPGNCLLNDFWGIFSDVKFELEGNSKKAAEFEKEAAAEKEAKVRELTLTFIKEITNLLK